MGIFNLVKKKRRVDAEDFEKNLYSIMEFLANSGRDVKAVYELGLKVKKIRQKERSEVDSKKQLKLLEEEIKEWDNFLERFVMLERDTDVTGQRVKKISQVLRQEAEKMKKEGLDPELVKMVRAKDEWVFNW